MRQSNKIQWAVAVLSTALATAACGVDNATTESEVAPEASCVDETGVLVEAGDVPFLSGIDPAPPTEMILVVTFESSEAAAAFMGELSSTPLIELGPTDGLSTAIPSDQIVYFFFSDRAGLERGACRIVDFDPGAMAAVGDFVD